MRRLLLVAATLLMPVAAPAEEAAPADAGPAAPAITVAAVGEATLRDRIYASGTIAPVEEVSVAPQIEGQRIERLLVDVGDWVEAGAVMAELADETLVLQRSQLVASEASARAAVSQAEAQLAEARAAAEEAVRVRDRTAALREAGNASQAALDQAVAGATSALARVSATEQALAVARAQVELVALQIADVDLRLARTQVTAPVAGMVTARNAQVGAIASAAGQPMFVLIREGLLELQADVAEQDVLRLRAGQPAALRVVGLGEPIEGTVRLVEPTVDAATRLGRVRIAIAEPERVRAGLFAQAEILVSEARGLAAPVTAVIATATGAQVLRVGADGVVDLVEVETGIRDGGLIQITAGLDAGDSLVARAGAFVRPGDRITPVPVASN